MTVPTFLGKWFLSKHAVGRYINRCRPGLTFHLAFIELAEISTRAEFHRAVDIGVEEWKLPGDSPWRFRVAMPRPGDGRKPALVTVFILGGRRGATQRERILRGLSGGPHRRAG